MRAATGSGFVFGHSFGGFLALEAALKDSAFERMAVYEPGVSIDGSIPIEWRPFVVTAGRIVGGRQGAASQIA